ncbi:MAG: DUF2235 domain-containing protein [Candidatus Delongbacteria bacterium]
MRKLVVCCDGTWNTPDQDEGGVPVPTNVVRLSNALARQDEEGNAQLLYYHPGVGTEGSWWEKTKGGSVGQGLDQNIISAWRWLCRTWQPEDRLHLFGFSRGAFTVRSLATVLTTCGLPKLRELPDEAQWNLLESAFQLGYRERKPVAAWAGATVFQLAPADVRIHFLGVWDTVGALGIPDNLAILNLLDNHKRHAFHDTNLSDKVLQARHAVALDEERASFSPTLWVAPGREAEVKQVWFPGVHCDVGGGYEQTGLSDGALSWMIEEARAQGLAFRPDMLRQIHPNHQDVLHDSGGGLFKLLRTQPRSIPRLDAPGGADLHESARRRLAEPPIFQAPYRRTVALAPGENHRQEVYARERWNETGLWLEAGVAYEFRATGEWTDRKVACGPGGTKDGKFDKGELLHAAAGLWGRFEQLVKKAAKNEEADFWGTRRAEDLPWMALVGVVANGGNPSSDGTPAPHESFLIGESVRHVPGESGYLFCYANDAWNFYQNNRGSVRLTVTRGA